MAKGEGSFATFYRAAILTVLAGWLLVIGKNLILPIFAAVIAVYVVTTAADAMGRIPGLGFLPAFLRRLLVLVVFVLCLLGLGIVVAETIDELIVLAPTYKANLEAMVAQVVDFFGFASRPSFEDIRAATIAKIDFTEMLLAILGSVTSFGGAIFLVIVYAVFLVVERGSLSYKLAAAFPHGDQAKRTVRLIEDVNRKIGDYLATKTLINIILGAVSYVIMLIMGLDFALFWSVLIALFNYIPYVGTLAVLLPIVLSLAQFGSLTTTLILAALLFLAQLFSDNVLEPKLFSKQLNLSPFVIVLALSLWTALWGLPGAILAIPLTSMLTIIFAAFPATRFLAVLLSERIENGDEARPVGN